jgi:hypothetical protein
MMASLIVAFNALVRDTHGTDGMHAAYLLGNAISWLEDEGNRRIFLEQNDEEGNWSAAASEGWLLCR